MKLATEIKLKEIEKTYRGKTGCACGCGGEYYYETNGANDEAVTQEIIKQMKYVNKNIDRARLFYWGRNNGSTALGGKVMLEVENPSGTQVTRLYLK